MLQVSFQTGLLNPQISRRWCRWKKFCWNKIKNFFNANKRLQYNSLERLREDLDLQKSKQDLKAGSCQLLLTLFTLFCSSLNTTEMWRDMPYCCLKDYLPFLKCLMLHRITGKQANLHKIVMDFLTGSKICHKILAKQAIKQNRRNRQSIWKCGLWLFRWAW